MSEYYIYTIVKDFVKYWNPDASPEEYLSKLLQYQEKYVERNPISGHEHVQIVAGRSPDPDLFLQKYEQLDSGNSDLPSKYSLLLSLLQTHKGLAEEFRRKAFEYKKHVPRSHQPVNSIQNVKSLQDVEEICDQLTNVAKKVEEKKMRTNSSIDRKELQKKVNSFELSLWEINRPFMSDDFSNNVFVHNLLPIGGIPRSSQEKYLVKDILQCLLGFNGKYIRGERIQNQRSFVLESSIYAPYKSIVSEILILAEYYSVIMRFIEDHQQYSNGRVNQALCAVLEDLMQDFRVSIIHLEMKHRSDSLNLQTLLFSVQAYLENMSCLCRVVQAIDKAGARGGRTLSLLHDAGKHYAVEYKAVDQLVVLIREASVPYFETLEQWIHTGYVCDPSEEFMIDDNAEMDDTKASTKGVSPHDYWKRRYLIKNDQVPTFLQQYQEKILRTGKYLNTIKQCSEYYHEWWSLLNEFHVINPCIENVSVQEMNAILANKPVSKKMCYTSLNSREFTQTIDTAYNFASDTLLNLLMKEYDIMNRLKSLKRYFLIEQGDFLSILMDLCEEDFEKPVQEISPTRLNSLVELAIRTCSGSKIDPYKADIFIQTGQEELMLQIFKINSINTIYEKEYKNKNSERNLSGLDVIILHLSTTWPVSLIFNEKVIGCYQMLFRLLLHCKYVERLLCKVWICDQQFKGLEKDSRKHYMRAFLLRRKMLLFIKNINHYMTNEVIEQHWHTFMNVIKQSKNVDDVMNHHGNYLKDCMEDCMLTSSKLIKQLTWLLKTCNDFCNFIQDMRIYFMDAEFTAMLSPNDYLNYSFTQLRVHDMSKKPKKSCSSFKERIKKFECEFNNSLGILLQLISLSGVTECGSQLLHFLTRQNFNGYYSNHMGVSISATNPQSSK